MSNISLRDPDTVTAAERGREFWRGVLLAAGFTALQRWTLHPVPGVGEHEAPMPDELMAALRRLAKELAVPLSSVLLTAHAKVLAALSGECEVSTGYAVEGRPPLPCRITTGLHSWRGVLLETHRAELELLTYKDFPFDDLRRELGLNKPLFETVFELVGADTRVGPYTSDTRVGPYVSDTRVGPYVGGRVELAEDTVLQVGFVEH